MDSGCWHRLAKALGGCALLLHAAAQAASVCSQPMRAPVAALGLSVTVTADGTAVGGIYPELLRGIDPSCRIEYQVVPRARQQRLFEIGKADLLIPASRTPQRDEYATFVPVLSGRAVLISLTPQTRAPVRSAAELLERRELRVAVVRGYDFGPEYRQLTEALAAKGRLLTTAEASSVVRMLDEGIADVALMNSSILLGAMLEAPKLRGMVSRLHNEALPELPWAETGVYVSKRSGLTEAEQHAVIEQIEALTRSGRAWAAYQKRFPPGSLNDSIRPRWPGKEEGSDAQR